MSRKYTKEGLIKISPYVVDVLFRDLYKKVEEGDLEETLLTEIEQRVEDNPGFRHFMDKIDKIYEDKGLEEIIPCIAIGYYLAYEVFRRQAETNKLERNRKIKID